ncbi:hypothetical protein [Streptomyces glomeratus]|uniref:Secreted protein n=1 Tax=Streptomyces glomeratus TaxID=284452 RepID=A0ABP6LSD3_9ACTN|nr:hypothetical protein [Streptomyces glomeratus]MCF1507717.1 hypothetical protein [Streptomyces glomeratus]
MVRGTTVRWVLTALSAVLLALQLCAPTTTSFTSASRTHATAAGSPEPVTSKRADDADEAVTCGGIGHPAGRTGPLRTRDRHRTAAGPLPGAPTPSAYDDSPAGPAAAVRPASPHISRPSTAHTEAALQVFRC